MKKYLILSALILIAAGCNTQNHQPATQTYKQLDANFEFQYPAGWGFMSPTYSNLSQKFVQVGFNGSAYPHTNFGDAALTVSSDFAKNLNDCLKLQQANIPLSQKASINGVDFYWAQSSGAGAGNFYETKTYRTLRPQSTCLEINETVHTSNIANFPPGAVTEVDKNQIWQQLDQALQTFKFTAAQ